MEVVYWYNISDISVRSIYYRKESAFSRGKKTAKNKTESLC